MNKVYFMNNGHFDVRAMTTMGVSVKDEGAIGYFGTGFKYAISIILRLGGKIKIKSNEMDFVFETKKESIKGKYFDLVYMNDEPAGFTTHLGINWHPWMAFRELYCNAKDEGGVISDKCESKYDTIIEVDCADIYNAFVSQKDYFISGTPIESNEEVDVYEGGHPFLYYRGVAVQRSLDNQKYSYNIKSKVDLTEDRTAMYRFQLFEPIKRFYQVDCKNEVMLRKVLSGGDHGEAIIGFDYNFGASDLFLDVCRQLVKTNKGICESARVVLSKIKEKSADWPTLKLSSVQEQMLEKAISFLEKLNMDPTLYPIKTVKGLGEGVYGRAHENVIYLSEIPFQMGTKQVASTLIEEWVHLKYGCNDFDRQMQTWLFDKVISMGEEINGAPL